MNPRECAQHVLDVLNDPDREWSLSFTAKRGYCPKLLLDDGAGLQVFVVPKSLKTQRTDETGWEHRPAVDIGVLRKLPAQAIQTGLEHNPAIDPLINFVAELINWFQSDDYAPPEDWELIELENDPIFDPGHLVDQHQFTSVITLVYRGVLQS